HAVFVDDVAIALGEFLAEFVHLSVVLPRQYFAEGGKARGHGIAVGVVGSAMKDLVLDNEIHHVPAGAKRRQRNAAADGFRQGDHVRLDAEVFAGAAPAELRPGFYFVENEKRAVFGADVAQSLQKTGLWHAQPDVHQDGLENDGGNLPGELFEAVLDAGKAL